MKLRVGAWMIAATSLVAALVLIAAHVYGGLYRTEHLRLPPLDGAIGCVKHAGDLVAVMLAIAFAWCARATTGPARGLFAASAIATAAAPLVMLAGLASSHDEVARVLRGLQILGGLTFALAAIREGGGKRLGWATVVVAGLLSLLAIVPFERPFVFAIPLDVMMSCIALDLLGVFPAIARSPQAQLRHADRRGAGVVVGLVLVACGLAIFGVAGELVVELDAPVSVELLLGTSCVIAGVLVVWRVRGRRVWMPIVVAMALSSIGIGDAISKLAATPLDRAALEWRLYPGFAIELPEGLDEGTAFAEAGAITRTPKHARLTKITASWGHREITEPLSPALRTTTTVAHGHEIRTVMFDTGESTVAQLAWTCDRSTWIDVRIIGRPEEVIDLERLAAWIAPSIRCLARFGPPLELAFHHPDFAPAPSDDPQITRYVAADAELDLAWTKDLDYVADLRKDPKPMFDWLGGIGADPDRIVTRNNRTYVEAVQRGRRLIVGAWWCERGMFAVAAGYLGPESTPFETAIGLLESVHCP